MVSDYQPVNRLKLLCTDSCCDHSARVARINQVSEPSALDEGELPQFCDRNPSVLPILLSCGDDFLEATVLRAPHRTQLVGRAPTILQLKISFFKARKPTSSGTLKYSACSIHVTNLTSCLRAGNTSIICRKQMETTMNRSV